MKFDSLKEMAQVEVNEILLAEVPDQFVDYMVLNHVALDRRYQAFTPDKEGPELYLNNYVSLNYNSEDTLRSFRKDMTQDGAKEETSFWSK